ncbi:hypothetical protein PG984_012315 [Apiospora sp. TS-2023a]
MQPQQPQAPHLGGEFLEDVNIGWRRLAAFRSRANATAMLQVAEGLIDNVEGKATLVHLAEDMDREINQFEAEYVCALSVLDMYKDTDPASRASTRLSVREAAAQAVVELADQADISPEADLLASLENL